MKLFSGLVIFLIGLSSLWAQPFEVTFNTVDPDSGSLAPLDSLCGGATHRIADGATVEVWWDLDPEGPDTGDMLAPLCDTPPNCDSGAVNFNLFAFNGEAVLGSPEYRGSFFSGYFAPFAANPNPARYYLRICLPTCHYFSRTMTFTPGQRSDIYLGHSDWICTNEPCADCGTPIPAELLTASDSTLCHAIQLDWTWTGPDPRMNGFQIYRNDELLARTSATDRSYLDTTALPGQHYDYTVKSRNSCGRTSAGYSDYGSTYRVPQTPQQVNATSNQCGVVMISWSYSTAVGLDSFHIMRGNTQIGVIPAVGAPGMRFFTDSTSETDSIQYYVVATNNYCGMPGVMSIGDYGMAMAVPDTMSFYASQGLTGYTVISWLAIPRAIRYSVYRSAEDGSGEVMWVVNPPATSYLDRNGDAGVPYRYTVSATNACGTGLVARYQLGWRAEPNALIPGNGGTIPSDYTLEQNYPNPFNPSTQISYGLAKPGGVSLMIYNLLGQKVASFRMDGQAAGSYTITFDGSSFPAGVYLYRLQAGEFVQTRKMMLLK